MQLIVISVVNGIGIIDFMIVLTACWLCLNFKQISINSWYCMILMNNLADSDFHHGLMISPLVMLVVII